MCLAVPGQVVELLHGKKALVDYGGTRREADITFVNAGVGDWVIVHAGFALQILDENEARETLSLWKEAFSYHGEDPGDE
jgi:hydrogenase expression/formation protein HypC